MPLLGSAAMLLLFDVAEESITEHDHWHTHEHLPERMSIPGFIRGSRWLASKGPQRYFVLYEVEQLTTLTSPAYLERLNQPSAWTSKMMPHYRGMTRGFCSVAGSFGFGMGHACALLRFKPAQGNQERLRQWLIQDKLSGLAARQGIGSAHLFESAVTPPMTKEQKIRGTDAGFDWTLLITGYSPDALTRLIEHDLSEPTLQQQGATEIHAGMYQLAYSLDQQEIHRQGAHLPG